VTSIAVFEGSVKAIAYKVLENAKNILHLNRIYGIGAPEITLETETELAITNEDGFTMIAYLTDMSH
jgi:hypothetical protein